MLSDYSETALKTLEEVLRRVYSGATQIVQPAAGGFIVGLVDPKFATAMPGQHEFLEMMKVLGPVNAATPNARDRIVIFTLRFYADGMDVYNRQAALRTRPNTWDGGVSTHYASAQDAYLLAHEIDTEAMLTDPQALAACRVIPDTSIVSLATSPSAYRYVQFDLEGHSLAVDRVEDLGDGIWKVHVT
jgi:hypothetical protein